VTSSNGLTTPTVLQPTAAKLDSLPCFGAMPEGATAKVPRLACSLATFDEMDRRCVLNSPRSLQACKKEGVLPQDLVYKPLEEFAEKNLSPRLVKLRFDFFEAKRKDLLAASRRARDALLAEERREKEGSRLDIVSRDTGFSKGTILALNSDGLKAERQKLLRAQENERNWLRNALNNELEQLKKLEEGNEKLTAEEEDKGKKAEEIARRQKEVNDKRQQEEERKQMEVEARQKMERQIAKAEFIKQQEELQKKKEIEDKKQKEAYERQLKEMEKKKKAEEEKAEKRELAHKEQEARKNEMRAQDLRRQDVMEQQKQAFQVAMQEKKELHDMRTFKSIQKNMKEEHRRREEFEEKQRKDLMREERLMQERALEQEASAKKSFKLMMKRKLIQEEAIRKTEEKRQVIEEEQEDTEFRLLEHEQKKERYLDFKKELDGLRTKNKEINVERQRRREEAAREEIAEQVRKKDEKIDAIRSERERLYQIRRAAQSEAYRAREMVRNEIMKQRVASKYNSKALKSKLEGLLKHELFTPDILTSSASAPLLKVASQMTHSCTSEDLQ